MSGPSAKFDARRTKRRAAARRARRPRAPSASAGRRGRSRPPRRGAWCRRRRASRRRACASPSSSPRAAQALDERDAVEARAARSTISTAAPSGCACSAPPPASPRGRPRAACRARWSRAAGRRRRRRREPSTARGCGGTPAAPTPGGPTSGSSRRGRCAPRAAPARRRCPASSSSFSVPCVGGAAAAWPNWWATRIRQCQSCCE